MADVVQQEQEEVVEEVSPLAEEAPDPLTKAHVNTMFGSMAQYDEPEEANIITANRGPEYALAQAADELSYDTATISATAEEDDKRIRAAQHLAGVSYGDELRQLVSGIKNMPPKRFTNGEAIAGKLVQDKNPVTTGELAAAIDTENTKRLTLESAMANIEEKGDPYKAFTEPSEKAYKTAQHLARNRPTDLARLEKDYEENGFSWENVVEFLNPIGGEDPEGMGIEWWETAKSIFTGEFDYDDFNTRMESNYGEDWEWRFSGFLVKEGVIDAVVLLAAMSPLSPIAFAMTAANATLKARLAAAAARSVVVGAGGGVAQSLQNVSIGREANLGTEVAMRTVGAMGGEALFAGARAGANFVRGKYAKADIADLANLTGKNPIPNQILTDAYKNLGKRDPLLQAVYDANIVSNVKKAEELIRTGSMNVLRREELTQDMLDATARLVGKSVEDLQDVPLDAILSHAMKYSANVAKRKSKGGTHWAFYDLITSIKGDYLDMTRNVELFHTKFGLDLFDDAKGISAPNQNMITSLMKAAHLAENPAMAQQTASNLVLAEKFTARIQKLLAVNHKSAMKGLSKKEAKKVYELLSEGDMDGKVFDFSSTLPKGGVDGISDATKAAYAKLRMNFDIEHMVRDAAFVQAVKGKIFKYKGDYVSVKPSKTSGKHVIEGKYDPNTRTVSKDKTLPGEVRTSELKDFDTILPYRTGYQPRMYRNHSFTVGVVDAKRGLVQMEAGFDDLIAARRYMDSRQAAAQAEGKQMIQLFTKADTGMGGITMKSGAMDMIASVDEGARASLKDALRKAGVDEKTANIIVRNEKNIQKAGIFEERTDLGIAVTPRLQELRKEYANLVAAKGKAAKNSKTVKAKKLEIQEELAKTLELTDDAAMSYYQVLAHKSGHAMWLRSAVDHFDTSFGKYLQPGETWHEFDKAAMLTKHGAEIADQAEALQKFINRFNYKKSRAEQYMDDRLIAWHDKLARSAQNGSVAAGAILKLVAQNTPHAQRLQGILRSIGAVPKLLTFNLPHVFIQASQAVPTMGSAFFRDPRTAFSSLMQIPEIMSLHGATRMGKKISAKTMKRDAYKAYNALVKSGFLADLNTSDIAFNAGSHLYKSNASILRAAANKIGSGYEKTLAVASAPFRLGEGINRISAFTVVYNQLSKQLDNGGTLNFGTKVLSKSDLDSPAFLNMVTDKAKVLALDMTKAGELKGLSGFNSVLFQFKQVLPKQISMFNSNALTGREKLGAAAAMIAMWGGAGIPLAADIIAAADYFGSDSDDPSTRYWASEHTDAFIRWAAENAPDYIGAENVEVFLKRGAVAALTNDEVNIISRVALGNFINDMVDVQEPEDLIVSVAVISDLLEAASKTGTFGLTPFTLIPILGRIASGDTFQEAALAQFEPGTSMHEYISGNVEFGTTFLEFTREYGRTFSALGGVSRVLDAHYREYSNPAAEYRNPYAPQTYMTSSLRNTDVAVNPMRSFMQVIGFVPGKVVEKFNMEDMERGYATAVKEAYTNFRKDIRRHKGNMHYVMRRVADYTTAMTTFRQKMVDMGIDVTVVKDPRKQGLDLWNKEILGSLYGEQ